MSAAPTQTPRMVAGALLGRDAELGALEAALADARQGRGRLVRALRERPVPWANIADATGWPEERERALRVARALVAEGLAVDGGDRLSLPL